jgi:SAM-dependent methyltransferase
MRTSAETGARAAYDAFAAYYDRFTAHHDYELWTSELLRLAERHGLAGRRLLDVGCGTGKSFLPYLERGWAVTACDISPAMLARAAAKAEGRAELVVADARRLPVLGSFDLVQCLDDLVNYLDGEDELTRAFAGLRSNLAPGGLLLFDANTRLTYRTFFAQTTLLADDDLVLAWEGHGAVADSHTARATLHAFERAAPGRWRRARSDHVQHHHDRSRVLRALGRAGLHAVGVCGHGFDARPQAPLDEDRHTKAVYVARASAPEEEGR